MTGTPPSKIQKTRKACAATYGCPLSPSTPSFTFSQTCCRMSVLLPAAHATNVFDRTNPRCRADRRFLSANAATPAQHPAMPRDVRLPSLAGPRKLTA